MVNPVDHNSTQPPSYSEEELRLAGEVLRDIETGLDVFKAIRLHPLPGGGGFLSKHSLITAYRKQVKDGLRPENRSFSRRSA